MLNESLHRAARGIYFNDRPGAYDRWLVERVAQALKPGHFTYISLATALSAWGVISQVPYALTLMTTGRSGAHDVPLYRPGRPSVRNPAMRRNGCHVTFTHTARSPDRIRATVMPGYHLLPFAEPEQALADYRRCQPVRSVMRDELDMETYREVVAERREYRASLADAGQPGNDRSR